MPAVPDGFRDLYLRAMVAIGVGVVAISELLSIFGALHRIPLILCWIVFAVGATALNARRIRALFQPSIRKSARDPVAMIAILGTLVILALTAITAAHSPPNSSDAMAYHMPRVVYWAEQGSVRFFPTPFLNQIMLQPLAEYFMLHSYVISGGDHSINFVQWFASVGSMVGVSLIAALFGAGPRGQAIAALFCATLPSGILASSGAKNDYVLAMWLVAAIYFGARFVRSLSTRDVVLMGAALGLALLTKATAYLFVPWLVAAILLPRVRSWPARLFPSVGVAFLFALLLNTPHYVRNLQLSGSILGFDSAQADGFFRWRNETFGWKQTLSNMLRNSSEQLGGRSEQWNQQVYEWTVRAHQRLDIDVNDPATTWRWILFRPPRNANHEADANSKWHLLIFGIASILAVWRALRSRNIEQVLYVLAILCGFVAFCAYLKWQLFEARLFLPLLVACSPIAGAAFDQGVGAASSHLRLLVQLALCLFLLDTARHATLENWVRPLEGARSVLHVPRDDQYFADMTAWNNGPAYKRTVQLLTARDCPLVGIDATNLSLEYPLMALLKEARPGTLFLHTGVHNASVRFPPSIAGAPCAVVCLDCAGDEKRQGLYASYPVKTMVDKFVVFQAQNIVVQK